VRQRRVNTELWKTAGAEEEAREQAAALNAAREISAAGIKSAKGNKEAVG